MRRMTAQHSGSDHSPHADSHARPEDTPDHQEESAALFTACINMGKGASRCEHCHGCELDLEECSNRSPVSGLTVTYFQVGPSTQLACRFLYDCSHLLLSVAPTTRTPTPIPIMARANRINPEPDTWTVSKALRWRASFQPTRRIRMADTFRCTELPRGREKRNQPEEALEGAGGPAGGARCRRFVSGP